MKDSPEKDILHWPKTCLESLILSFSSSLPVFSRAFHLISLPQIFLFLPSLLSYSLSSHRLLCVALFDFLTEFLIVWSFLFFVFNSLPDPTSQSLELPWIRDTLTASDHSFLLDGGGVSLNKLTSYISYHACQTKFLHFSPKTEEWNKNLNRPWCCSKHVF